jgi:hypothetical protein
MSFAYEQTRKPNAIATNGGNTAINSNLLSSGFLMIATIIFPRRIGDV